MAALEHPNFVPVYDHLTLEHLTLGHTKDISDCSPLRILPLKTEGCTTYELLSRLKLAPRQGVIPLWRFLAQIHAPKVLSIASMPISSSA